MIVQTLTRLAVVGSLLVTPLLAVTPAPAAEMCFGELPTIPDNPGPILGTDGHDVIINESGDDLINGAGGNDFICGGTDNDFIIGGTGSDKINGGGGTNDTVVYWGAVSSVEVDLQAGTATGGDGSDQIENVEAVLGSSFDDSIKGSDLSDQLVGAGGHDVILGRDGADLLDGDFGDGLFDDTLSGGPGTDWVWYGWDAGPVNVDLGAGTATGVGIDTLIDIEGAYGSDGSDQLYGGPGTNFFVPDSVEGISGGNDFINGRRGADFVFYLFATGPMDVATASVPESEGFAPSPKAGSGWASGADQGFDTLSGTEAIYGTEFGDFLYGSAKVDAIFGGDGDDTIYGLGKSDFLNGGNGTDTLDGGGGRMDKCPEGEIRIKCESNSAESTYASSLREGTRGFRKH